MLYNVVTDGSLFLFYHHMTSNNDVTIGVNSFDALFQNACNNFDEVRGRSLALSVHNPKTLSMSSSDCKKYYATRLEKQNDRMDEDEPVAPSSSVQLEYETSSSQNGQVSKAANVTNTACQ